MFKFIFSIILLLLIFPNFVQLDDGDDDGGGGGYDGEYIASEDGDSQADSRATSTIHRIVYNNEYECIQHCGGAYGGQCQRTNYNGYWNYYECICEHGFDGKNCTICAPGYFGANCTFQCPPGLWGENCANKCNCSKAGSISENACSPINGNCICKAGYSRQKNGSVLPIWEGKAQDCIYPCESGYWGTDCQNRCDCQNGAFCNPVSGKCLCLKQWTGEKCEKRCHKGKAMTGCRFSCNCVEDQGKCNELTGHCSCFSGFMGPRCQWPCPNGFWGPGCQKRIGGHSKNKNGENTESESGENKENMNDSEEYNTDEYGDDDNDNE